MASLFPAVRVTPRGHRKRGRSSPADLVFSDYAAVPHPHQSYWTYANIPHLVHCQQEDSLQPPPRWLFFDLEVAHSEAGGSTDARHKLLLLLPPGCTPPFNLSVPFSPQPWVPVEAAIDSRIGANMATSPDKPLQRVPEVTWVEGDLSPFGLFPSRTPGVHVRVPCVFLPLGWGARPLRASELATLWDVPLLFQEWCRDHDSTYLLTQLLSSVPGKTLLLGGDVLLTRYFRGGDNSLETGVDAVVGHSLPEVLSLGVKRCRTEKGATSDPQDLLDEVDEAVIKADGQKADDAEIPIHLWDGFVKRAFLDDHLVLPPRWRRGLRLFCFGFIRWWRRAVMVSFWAHVRSRVGGIRSPYPSPAQQRGWVMATPGKGRRRPTGLDGNRMIQYDFDWYYTWSPGGRSQYLIYHSHLKTHPPLKNDWEPARDCIRRAAAATWWDWDQGSRLLFWRWPADRQLWAREGQPHFLIGNLPSFKSPQSPAKTLEDAKLMKLKVGKVRQRGYIEPGFVLSLTHMFYVPKGISDIRMVYNGTSCGLNDVLWAPHFGLPIMQHTLRSLLPNYYQCDMDVGEMFLNFMLHPALRPYSGVDITHIRSDESWEAGRTRAWERWCRNFMGMTDSPFRSFQMLIKLKFISYGDRQDANNPFNWERVQLNLPGSPDYDPSLPWVMKIRGDGHLASDIYVYVDDGRATGWNFVECWRAVRRFCSVCSHRGVQDASRKRTKPTQEPGPWAGTVVHTKDQVSATITLVKWQRMQSLISELSDMSTASKIPHKRLEQIRGFLVYITRTYRWMTPYLKGLHLTLDAWRCDRDEEGWRKKGYRRPPRVDRELDLRKFEDDSTDLESLDDDEGAPELVTPVPRFRDDVIALKKLTQGNEPALQKCRVKTTMVAFYLLGDASGRGFGSGFVDNLGIWYESANWADHLCDESSNFREAHNLVSKIEALGAEGKLSDRELFTFTDNSTFESTFYKGHSSSKKLNDIIFRLRMVERKYGIILHVIWIAGTRMKKAGIDGLSRGDLLEGMMAGADPLSFVPLNEHADERSLCRVSLWIQSWWNDAQGQPWCGMPLKLLTPTDWFELYKLEAPRLWVPPPAAMETVVELFNEDRIAHPHIPHVFAVPCLMTHLWRKTLSKDADVLITIRPGSPFWPRSMHESLILIIVLPLSYAPNYSGPWALRRGGEAGILERELEAGFKEPSLHGCRKFHDLAGSVSGLRDPKEGWSRTLLFQFLNKQKTFPPVSWSLVRKMLPQTSN